MGRFMSGVTTGAIVGAAFGMMIMPQLDRKTQKSLKRAGKMVMNLAEERADGMMGFFK
ncbi:hypothetical protein JHL18_14840 [Clostridium sp. YIM B02505]|uniref:YtxH-like protein n=1 Tax=Clostridium yunnanense TaxID=2800325 RepID=A0ABS1ER93_9CLOT|nr:hypothetical protein [Clostridium yunnanense]MBK1811896.1 hypothetical protein [Clostridium yunnanense]